MSSVLVTGAGGYVGGRLVKAFLARDWTVHALNREPAPRLGVEETVCDLADEQALSVVTSCCEKVDAVVHLAGEDEVVASRRPAAALASTVMATERVAEACANSPVRRLVYLSTMHVYGERIVPGAVLDEEMRVEPRTAYAISRLASEHVVKALSREAYELVTFRLTNSLGAPDDPSVDRWSLVANDLCRQGALQGKLQLRSSGTQWRDFVPLGAVCDAIATAAEANGAGPRPGTYNLGSGQPITVRGLAEMIQDTFERETGKRPELLAPDPEADPPGPYHVAVDRAVEQGLRLTDPVDGAVAETVRFCLEHREALPSA